MTMSPADTAETGGMISDINTTPLIDVMLVLLIMFILTIPLQTQAVKIDVPRPAPSKTRLPPPTVKNEVTIDPQDRIYWNGTQVDLATLQAYLFQSQQMDPTPELHIRPHPQARYDTVDKVLAAAKRAQVARMGFVGNERYANF